MRRFLSMVFTAVFALIAGIVTVPVEAQTPDQFVPEAKYYGVVGHFLKTPDFKDNWDPNWRLPVLMKQIKKAGIQRITFPIFSYDGERAGLIRLEKHSPQVAAGLKHRRDLIDQWLTLADQEGLIVSLHVFAKTPRVPRYKEFNRHFTDWIAELIQRHPNIKTIQFHNEPNIKFFWRNSTPEEYVEVYREIAHKFKAVRPDIQMTVGAIASLSWPKGRAWLRRAMDAGLLEFADAVSVHPYTKRKPPEDDPHFNSVPGDDLLDVEEAFINFNNEIQSRAPNGKKLGILLTEFGYSSSESGSHGVGSEKTQADYLSRSILIYIDLNVRHNIPIEAVFWYDLKDDGTDPNHVQHNFGLLSYDLTREKDAYRTYAAIIKAIPDVSKLEPASLNVSLSNTSGIKHVNIKQWLQTDDSTYIVAFWNGHHKAEDRMMNLLLDHPCDVVPAPITYVQLGMQETVPAFKTIEKNGTCQSQVPVALSIRASLIKFRLKSNAATNASVQQ
ncbi:hypothetical protein [uncultured Roseibium sp.]|uniref:hypothetical protein n=1 Tax=uncultured Roseibium sp. TaxID=1936171 RepID=UPI00321781F9